MVARGQGMGMQGRRAGLAGTMLGVGLLAACSANDPVAPIACPQPSIPADAADLTRYRPGPVRDLTTLEFDARLSGLQGGCRPGRRNESISMQLAPSFTVDRGAAAAGRTVVLPWSVAVLDATTNEPFRPPQRFLTPVGFGPNETRTSVAGDAITVELPVSDQRRATDYRILVFLQLTEEELALNRRRGPR